MTLYVEIPSIGLVGTILLRVDILIPHMGRETEKRGFLVIIDLLRFYISLTSLLDS